MQRSALLVTLTCLFCATYNGHVLALVIIAAALFVSIEWYATATSNTLPAYSAVARFISEIIKVEAEQKRANAGIERAKEQ
jgi:hypothetical protein